MVKITDEKTRQTVELPPDLILRLADEIRSQAERECLAGGDGSRECPQEPRKGPSEAKTGEGGYYVPPELFAEPSEAKNGVPGEDAAKDPVERLLEAILGDPAWEPEPRFYFSLERKTTTCVIGSGPDRMVGKARAGDGDEYDPVVGAILSYFRCAYPDEYRAVKELAFKAADAYEAEVAEKVAAREAELREAGDPVEVDPEVGKRLFDAIFGAGANATVAEPEPEPEPKPRPKAPAKGPARARKKKA